MRGRKPQGFNILPPFLRSRWNAWPHFTFSFPSRPAMRSLVPGPLAAQLCTARTSNSGWRVIFISDSSHRKDPQCSHWTEESSPPQCLNSYLMGDHRIGIFEDVEQPGYIRKRRALGERTVPYLRVPGRLPEQVQSVTSLASSGIA